MGTKNKEEAREGLALGRGTITRPMVDKKDCSLPKRLLFAMPR